MKYCAHCGKEMDDNAVICLNCGCRAETHNATAAADQKDLSLAVKIFMIIGTVISGIAFLLPLAWTIPMTVSIRRRLDKNQPIGIGFKICVLLFVSTVAGILLFFVKTDGVAQDNNESAKNI